MEDHSQIVNDRMISQPGNIRTNLFAGYLSKVWFVVIALVCTPYYVRVLGADGYGLVGFFLTLQRLTALLDSGLSTTINREMTRDTSIPGHRTRVQDMLRTLELVYWGISLAVFAGIALASGWISRHWIHSDSVSPEELQALILLMGLAISVQLPQSFYSAALAGKERHVALNVIRMIWQGARFIGAVAVLALISSTPFAFFGWQVATGILVTAATAATIWKSLPRLSRPPRFRRQLLRDVARFTAGAGTFTVSAVLISQMDKVILSNQISSEHFGYYMLAFSIPSTLYVISSPIYSVIFPRISRHLLQNDESRLKRSYFFGSQLTVLAIVPAAVTGAFFSREILSAWLNDSHIADQCHLLTTLLFCGIGINCLSSMPHALQMAAGWTRLANTLNLLSIAILGPVLYWACHNYGGLGASVTWVIYATAYLVLQVHFMHQKLLPDEKTRWCRGILVPLLLNLVVAGCARLLLHPTGRLETVACFMVTWGVCCLSVLLVSPIIRKGVFWTQVKKGIWQH